MRGPVADFSALMEHGISAELRLILEALRETTGKFEDTHDSKFGKPANDWLRTAVLTRNLSRPIYYLVNLWCVVTAQNGFGRKPRPSGGLLLRR